MDTPIGTLRCPGCGGDARPDSVRCDWCGASLATVSCPACFGTMFVGMKHCPSCGAEPAREDLAGVAAGPCPRCGVKMFPVKVGKSHLSECRKCGGLWVDTSSFEQICEDREDQEQVLGIAVPVPEKRAIKSRGPQRMYVPCPVCSRLMHRVNFGSVSGVLIDWCKDHGSWFDNEELRQIIVFIQGGGLKKTRQREKERLKEEAQRLHRKELRDKADINVPADARHAMLSWMEDNPSFLDFLSAVWKSLSR